MKISQSANWQSRDIGGIDEIGREGMRKMLGKIADQVTAFALLRYSEQEGCWVRSEFSHFESVVDCLARVFGRCDEG